MKREQALKGGVGDGGDCCLWPAFTPLVTAVRSELVPNSENGVCQ
jgi:hypothetical protein